MERPEPKASRPADRRGGTQPRSHIGACRTLHFELNFGGTSERRAANSVSICPHWCCQGHHACLLDHSAQREWGALLACSPANSQSRAAGAFCNAYRRNGLSPQAGLDDTTSRRRSLALPQLLFEREDLLPVVLHADDRPALRLRYVVHLLAEGADLGVGQSLRRTVRILAGRIVVQHQSRQPRAGTSAFTYSSICWSSPEELPNAT
jgi:hypothetical protein